MALKIAILYNRTIVTISILISKLKYTLGKKKNAVMHVTSLPSHLVKNISQPSHITEKLLN